ncbi:hypothetical protein GGTG_03853 [Gaeumannomyces tritici R3-111a-1]|uniref:Uncharacterized protein n=1 Tax=Gaeumannomyces tritici (strain R3-111a-1) TaxID=644352 RepID=J3NRE9_GAET3|nr:hypothetical protein GGTG_03853 [Gaeumannomyces tritici R3-111a-1]EJT78755.1 hypothetical protein GGTG_03853 [Gaeumannomyces tritici R3-111a-1]
MYKRTTESYIEVRWAWSAPPLRLTGAGECVAEELQGMSALEKQRVFAGMATVGPIHGGGGKDEVQV